MAVTLDAIRTKVASQSYKGFQVGQRDDTLPAKFYFPLPGEVTPGRNAVLVVLDGSELTATQRVFNVSTGDFVSETLTDEVALFYYNNLKLVVDLVPGP